MESWEVLAVFLVIGLMILIVIGGFWLVNKSNSSYGHEENEAVPSPAVASTVAKPSALRGLPYVVYVIACLGFAGWIIIALNLESWEVFGCGIGATIACLASGRVIELLQNIDDELYRKRISESP